MVAAGRARIRRVASSPSITGIQVVAASLAPIQPLAERRGVALEHHAVAVSVRADQRRLQQVILNLLSNAVRFSPAGSTVRISTAATAHEGSIRVVDEGPGIPASLLNRLFVPFDRLGADAGREGGAGRRWEAGWS